MAQQTPNIWSVCIGDIYLICKTSQWNTHNQNTLMKYELNYTLFSATEAFLLF